MLEQEPLLALFEQAKTKDPEAFSRLVKCLEKPVFRMAYSLVGNREDAEDVAQETFFKLWKNMKSYREDASVLTFVLTIAKNTALDTLRKRKNHPSELPTVTDREGGETQADIPDPASDVPEEYLRRERIRAVRDAIAELPDEYRVILTLRDLEGCSYAQIGEVLGLQEGTVKSRLFRARDALKKSLIQKNLF